MFDFQTEEVLIPPRAQLGKQSCQQSRRCGNVYLEVERLRCWQTALLWFGVLRQGRPWRFLL